MTFPGSDYPPSAVILINFSHVVVWFSFLFFHREALLLVLLVRFDAFALTLRLNTSFARARGASPVGYSGAPIGDGEESY